MVLFTAFALGACNKNTPDEPTTPPNPDKTDTVDVPVVDASISCTPEKYEVLSGVDAEFEVVVKSEMAWKATCEQANVIITPAEGKGETSVSIKAPATGKAETAQVIFDNGKQKAVVKIVWNELVPNAFSVSASQQVLFAPGNLQYQASTDTWRFAENQWVVSGSANENYPGGKNFDYVNNKEIEFYEDPTVWMDLFGYSTHATNFGINNGASTIDYHGEFIDWGTKMPAQGDQPWRTLTTGEWEYLLYTRPNAADLKGMINIKEGDGIFAEENKGVVLLPDDWQCPAGITFAPYVEESEDNSYDNNIYTFAEWEQMEAAGAVLLPAAGFRTGSGIFTFKGLNTTCYYWAASAETEENWANVFAMTMWGIQMNTSVRGTGNSVRLARNVQ